jgi:endonuclease YncB( thermonuclease family)
VATEAVEAGEKAVNENDFQALVSPVASLPGMRGIWLVILGVTSLAVTLSCIPGSPAPFPSPLTNTCTTVICCSDCPSIPVNRVVDGATFDTTEGRIRLFGVDTPERGDKCFATAKDRLRELAGNSVRVENGPRQEDQYGRLLYYVYTEDGQSIDEMLIREGLALAWDGDGQHRDRLVATEEMARRGEIGCLWLRSP